MPLPPHTVIEYASQLKAADHISVPTELYSGAFRHHAIVGAPMGGNVFEVIHARPGEKGGDLNSSGSSDNYVVAEDMIDYSNQIRDRTLHRYDYAPDQCYKPFDVLQRAKSKLGPFAFNAVTNNCEHFAQWCKNRK